MRIQIQVLDCDYILLNGRPVIRIFGKNDKGEPICIFSNNFLPYFYLDTDDLETAARELKKKFNELSIETVERTLSIGFQENKKVLKIIGKDPSKTPEIRECAKTFGTPYEADVLFKYRFMINKGIRGMGWIEAEGKHVFTKTVKCKAFEATKIKPIERIDNTELKYMAYDIECITESDQRLPEPEKDPIIMISITFSPKHKGKESIVLVAKSTKIKDSIGFANEEEMLRKFLEILHDFDPDILIGYNINNYDLPYLTKRLEVLKLPRDLGRADKQTFLRKLQTGYVATVTGRTVVDPYEIIKRDPWVRFKRYDLGTIAKEMLQIKKKEIKGIREFRELWNGKEEGLKKLVEYSRRDSELALKLVIEKNLLDKFFELSKVSGLLLQDSLGGQAQRHECKLLHEFYKRKILMPCRPEPMDLKKYKEERGEHGLKGALVLEPKTGLHKSVLVLDFSSLYPSLIRTYNICPTTLLLDKKNIDFIEAPNKAKFVKKEIREGVLPAILRELLTARKTVKTQMKIEINKEKKRQLNAKQLALKDMANSLYGYTGYIRARLYVMDVANAITAFGRENIEKTKTLVESKFPVEVLYGDTDSIFIKTDIKDLEEAQKLGEEIGKHITEHLPGLLSLEFEKLYKTFLILTKKRYAGWKFEKVNGKWEDKIEMKGIETVRRDWCTLTTETMLNVLDIILKEGDVSKAAKYVRNVVEDIASGKIPLEKLTVVKGITKALDSYDGIQPHIELAKKIRARDTTKAPIVGERIGYIIVKGNQLISKRAEDPEFVKEKGLEVDATYYVENQLLPPLERVFEACGLKKSEVIEGSRQKKLFEILGDKKVKKPEDMVLDNFERIVCKKCDWNFRRVPLKGKCPKCDSQLYFGNHGFIGKFVKA